MRILGIETSCDETGASVVENGVLLRSNIVASSLSLHGATGGIIPERAAREQIKYIIPVIDEALSTASLKKNDIDAIAVTVGPGLIGSLLVGVETAKTLAYVWNKPIIPVNHLIGHIYANFIGKNDIEFPAVTLIVSGGHTDLVLMKKRGGIKWLGGTRDDAAGEAFDKIGRLLGLSYPGGPAIEKASERGDSNRFPFPRPLIDSNDFDFSFSGLKTAVLRSVQAMPKMDNETVSHIAASVQKAIIDVLIAKTLKAALGFKVKSILLAGGVCANQKLRTEMQKALGVIYKVYIPAPKLCTDNGAMIAAGAFFNYKEVSWRKVTANPGLYF